MTHKAPRHLAAALALAAVWLGAAHAALASPGSGSRVVPRAAGVCPPYKLRDEQGNVIDPVQDINADRPYSPRQTCGARECHDYDTITQGFHFTQGQGEAVPAAHARHYGWVTSPGQYGGRW